MVSRVVLGRERPVVKDVTNEVIYVGILVVQMAITLKI